MSPVDLRKWPCRPVEFKGQGPQAGVRVIVFPSLNGLGVTGRGWGDLS